MILMALTSLGLPYSLNLEVITLEAIAHWLIFFVLFITYNLSNSNLHLHIITCF